MDGRRTIAGGLSLGDWRLLPATTRRIPKSPPGHDRRRDPGLHHARLSVPLGRPAALDLFDAASLSGEWTVRPVADPDAAERVQLHGRDSAHRPGHEKR